ncbi:phosphoenolpyruvate synthase [Natronococcus amylolyticus DSM 10524]|uniref:Phosphoenolpyruvate synthase n=1 Tax=Natronococcus amylolyticus DSM 10524 TaxID=1227497 RepID=L9X332_9EURY|nr:hypothetical protein [Natronococcus amylolyticus]ELY55997.1 phosphoenolpyruvate synthase [Natronococcus amylolyticus DSM 10524]
MIGSVSDGFPSESVDHVDAEMVSSDGMDVHVNVGIPSNIVLADRFSELFDGFSIGRTSSPS